MTPHSIIHSSTHSLLTSLLGAGLIALCAQISLDIPGSPVPVTLQTLGLLSLAFLLGPVRVGLAVGCYLLAGGLGLPVFAGGAFGWEKLMGPSIGFFIGFGIGAVIVSYLYQAKRRFQGKLWFIFGLFVLGHAIILALGWIGLIAHFGAEGLWGRVFVPLLPGLFLKSLVGALAIMAIFTLRKRFFP